MAAVEDQVAVVADERQAGSTFTTCSGEDLGVGRARCVPRDLDDIVTCFTEKPDAGSGEVLVGETPHQTESPGRGGRCCFSATQSAA